MPPTSFIWLHSCWSLKPAGGRGRSAMRSPRSPGPAKAGALLLQHLPRRGNSGGPRNIMRGI